MVCAGAIRKKNVNNTVSEMSDRDVSLIGESTGK